MLHMDYIAFTLNVHSSYINQNLLVQHLQATVTIAILYDFCPNIDSARESAGCDGYLLGNE